MDNPYPLDLSIPYPIPHPNTVGFGSSLSIWILKVLSYSYKIWIPSGAAAPLSTLYTTGRRGRDEDSVTGLLTGAKARQTLQTQDPQKPPFIARTVTQQPQEVARHKQGKRRPQDHRGLARGGCGNGAEEEAR